MGRISLLFVFLIGFYSCDFIEHAEEMVLPSSSGKYGEVLVVIDTIHEKSKSGKILKQIFYKEIDALPQKEPMFRMATVVPNDFKSILKRSRNILIVTIGEGNKNSIIINEDVWAKDQMLIEVNASTDEKASEILAKNTIAIQNYFNDKEIQRLQEQYSIKPDRKLSEIIEKRFDLKILLPPAFVMMDSSGNGLWLKKEKQIGEHTLLQGLIIYELPYESDSTFSNNQMIKSRNDFCKTHIQGGREDSYMSVYEEFNPIKEEVNLNELYAVSYRGLWNMKNDFMGGPFVHYTFVDVERQRVIHADGFVYAPKFNKREYLRELKAILKTIKLKN